MSEQPIRIPRFPVSSSSLAMLGYDEQKKILSVEFPSGSVYHFAGVEPETAVALATAESIGRYFATNIKGKYWSEKMTGRCPACHAVGWIGDACGCGSEVFERQERKPRGQHDTAAEGSDSTGD